MTGQNVQKLFLPRKYQASLNSWSWPFFLFWSFSRVPPKDGLHSRMPSSFAQFGKRKWDFFFIYIRFILDLWDVEYLHSNIFKTNYMANTRSTFMTIKVVLGGCPRCPDNHELSKCHRLYDLGRHNMFLH